MKSLYKSAERVVHPLEELGIFLALSGLILTMLAQVFFRFVLENPLDISEELSRMCMIWLVFLGAARALRTCEHFMVDALFKAFPPPLARVVSLLIDVVTLGFILALLWVSASTSFFGARQILPSLGIPVVWQTAALPIGLGLMLFHSIGFILNRRPIGIPSDGGFVDEHGHAHDLSGGKD